MEQSKITFIVNGNTHSLRASDSAAIRDIPADERKQLIAFLEAVKVQDNLANTAVNKAVERATGRAHSASYPAGTGAVGNPESPAPERLGRGDVDALMARLVLEEKHQRKAGPTKQGVYKLAAGIAIGLIVLVLIF